MAKLFPGWEISPWLIKCNVDTMLINKLHLGVYILKAYNDSYETHIKYLKKCLSLVEEIILMYFVKNASKKLHVHFLAKTVKTKIHIV